MRCMYRTDRVAVEDTYQFNDSTNDEFQREPYCVKFTLNDAGLTAYTRSGASPQHGLGWTCPPHCFQKLFLRSMQIQSTKH